MAYGTFKKYSEKVLRAKAFTVASNTKHDAYQRGLVSIVDEYQ